MKCCLQSNSSQQVAPSCTRHAHTRTHTWFYLFSAGVALGPQAFGVVEGVVVPQGQEVGRVVGWGQQHRLGRVPSGVGWGWVRVISWLVHPCDH